MTAAGLRAQFPAFADSARYPDAQADFYIGLAGKLLSADRWGTVLDHGTALFAAHFLAIDRIASQGGTRGLPGTGVGIVTGGSVDKVSYTRSVSEVMETDAGHWGMTTYGLQYLRLARMMGMGPVQVGTGCLDGLGLSFYNGAWPGPIPGPW